MLFRRKKTQTAEFKFENTTELNVELIVEPLAEGVAIQPTQQHIVDLEVEQGSKIQLHVTVGKNQNNGNLVICIWDETEGSGLAEIRGFADQT